MAMRTHARRDTARWRGRCPMAAAVPACGTCTHSGGGGHYSVPQLKVSHCSVHRRARALPSPMRVAPACTAREALNASRWEEAVNVNASRWEVAVNVNASRWRGSCECERLAVARQHRGAGVASVHVHSNAPIILGGGPSGGGPAAADAGAPSCECERGGPESPREDKPLGEGGQRVQ